MKERLAGFAVVCVMVPLALLGYLVLWWGLCEKTERCCAGLQALLFERMKHWRCQQPLFP